MDRKFMFHSSGKKVYYINGQKFENDEKLRNGRTKAMSYCVANQLNPNEIIEFDSRLEVKRYEYLLKQVELGTIKNLTYHQKFTIIPSFMNYQGFQHNALTYEADFCYVGTKNDQLYVEDVKGSTYFIDDAFRAKMATFDFLNINRHLCIQVAMEDKESESGWKIWKGEQKATKRLKTQREQIKKQQKALHDKEIEENKIARLKERFKELKSKECLTKAEQKRLSEIEEILIEKGIILV